MRFASLGSGSRGNSTLIELGRQLLLVDNGFSLRETERRLSRSGKAPEDITALLVTHEHSDHLSGIRSLARKYELPVYTTPGTAHKGHLEELGTLRKINCHSPFTIDDVLVTPVPVPHDAREPCQFVFEWQGLKVGILTDLGHVTPHVRDLYQDCHGLLLEFNHDVDLLQTGPYPYPLKRRVGGDHGHLNNEQAAGLLADLSKFVLQYLVVSHMSEQNNNRERVTDLLMDALGDWSGSWVIADQLAGCNWCDLRIP